MSPRTLRAWSTVHTWSSLVCTAFVLMLCLTGLPLIFHHEIDDLLGHGAWAPANPDGPQLSYDQVLAISAQNRPGEVPIFLSFDVDRPVVNVTTGPTPDAPGTAMHFASYDLTSAAVVPQVADGGVMDFILQLHTDMFLGLPGMLFLGAMGLAFAAATVSGVVLYAPFMRKLPFGAVRREKAPRTRWLDHHNLLGVVTVAWVLVVTVTGIVNTLAVPIIAYWKDNALTALIEPYQGLPPAAPTASVSAAVEAAQAELPGMQRQFVAFPGGSFSTEHHYAIYLHGVTPVTEHLTTPVLVDARTGEITAVSPMPWYVKTLALSQPLHFGDYGGLPLKILWAVLDVATMVVCGSGLYLWVARRRGAKPAVQRAPARVLAPAE